MKQRFSKDSAGSAVTQIVSKWLYCLASGHFMVHCGMDALAVRLVNLAP